MIKLKSILKEIIKENIINENKSGTFEYTIDFDGQNILTFSKATDIIEVTLNIEYSINFGNAGSEYEPPEMTTVEILDYNISNIMIYDKNGKETEINFIILHPIIKQKIKQLIDSWIKKYSSRIENAIFDAKGGID